MCLIAIAYKTVPGFDLVALANRDEFYDRPTAPLHLWPTLPERSSAAGPTAANSRKLVGGRDLQAGGTWLAAASDAQDRGNPLRFSAVTNFRNPDQPVGFSSRGELVTDFVTGQASAEAFGSSLTSRSSEYAGFNLLLFDDSGLYYATNRSVGRSHKAYDSECRRLEPGIYALSNAQLDSPWPKSERLATAVKDLVDSHAPGRPLNSKAWLDLMLDDTQATPEEVPFTGIPPEQERQLSSAFMALGHYGTRSTTLVTITDAGAELIERRFGAKGYEDTSTLRLEL